VAERTGVTRRTLRHYDELGLLVPSARSWGDYRLYNEGDLLRLLQIQSLKALGLSLGEIAEALESPDMDAASTLRSHLAQLEQQIAAEQQLASQLRALAEDEQRSWEEILDAIALTRRLSHSDPIKRLQAAFLTPNGSTTELLQALTDETDPAVQEVLIWALAQHRDAAAAAIARLDDPNPDLRYALTRLLTKLHDPIAVPALITALDDHDQRVRNQAVTSLGQLPTETSTRALGTLIGSPTVRPDDLVDALANHGEQAVGLAIAALSLPDSAARATAAELLGRLGGQSGEAANHVVGALTESLSDPQTEVRQAALMGLSDLGPTGRTRVASMRSDPQLGALAKRLLELHVT